MNLKRKYFFFLWIVLLLHYGVFAQNNTDNIGFERGTFEGWQLSRGDVRLVQNKTTYSNDQIGGTNYNFNVNNVSVSSESHKIVSSTDGADPVILNEKIPMLYPGTNRYSVRFGNTIRGQTYERIKTSFKVSADQTLFQYHFAVLLQAEDNGNHTIPQRPGFALKISDENGNDLACGDFNVQLENSLLSGFKVQTNIPNGNVEYRNWTNGSIDLRNYVGQTLTISATVHGCGTGRHFGYAYFDAELQKSELSLKYSCPDNLGYMSIEAPDGFEKYKWNFGSTDRVGKVKATVGETVFVTITPYSSLDASCNFTLTKKIPHTAVTNNLEVTKCAGEKYFIEDTPYETTGKYTKVINRFNICDSTINLNLKVIPPAILDLNFEKCMGENVKIRDTLITTDGFYKIKIKQEGKCDSTVNANVSFEKFEIKTNGDQRIIFGDSVKLSSETMIGIQKQTTWWSEKQKLCDNCTDFTISPVSTLNYFVKAKSFTDVCTRYDTLTIMVLPCQIYLPDAFSPNGDNINANFYPFGSPCVAKINSFLIFDRWGEKIFERNDIPVSKEEYGWNGKINNQDIVPGVYIYKISALLKDGNTQQFDGTLSLFK